MTDTLGVLTAVLDEVGIAYEVTSGPGGQPTVVAEIPGEHKLKTATAFTVGRHVTINAFVVRAPDEHVERVHHWLLRRNLRLFVIAYAIDHLGDIYLNATIPAEAITAETVDQILGSVGSTADGDFDTLLELGFESAIRAEWKWRLDRGESTRNLQAFRHLAPTVDDAAGFEHDG